MRHGTAQGNSGGKTQPRTIPVAGIQTYHLQPWVPWILHISSRPWLRQEVAARPACLTRLGAPHWVCVPAPVLLRHAVCHSAPGHVEQPCSSRERSLAGLQCSLSPLAIQAAQDPCLLPSWEGSVPHLPSLLPVPDLGVSQPQGPSVPDLALFIDRARGCWASTPHHGPSLAQLSGCITSPTATHMPRALALLLPRVSLLSPLPPHCVATSGGCSP